jgi:hypothetical protein
MAMIDEDEAAEVYRLETGYPLLAAGRAAGGRGCGGGRGRGSGRQMLMGPAAPTRTPTVTLGEDDEENGDTAAGYSDTDEIWGRQDKAEADRLTAAKAEGRVAAGVVSKMFERVGMDEVTEAWMRVVVQKALPLDLFNDPVFRKAVALTAMAGRKIVVGGEDTFLPKRKHMTTKILPALDCNLTDKIQKKTANMSAGCGAVLVSDGWTSVSHWPIINTLAALPLGLLFLAALDTSGDTKDAQYIADFMIKQITGYGSSNVVGVCMDGACTASFPIIEDEFPHIFTYICPTRSLDNYMKNICCNKDIVRLKGIEGEFAWGEDPFSVAIDKVWEVVKFIIYHQKALARYRELAEKVPREERPHGGLELVRYCDTRFASKILMITRYRNVLPVLERLAIDDVYSAWLAKQPRDVKEKGAAVKRIIRDEDNTETVKVCINVLEPAVRLLRMTDTKLGATLGKVYGYMLQLDEHLREEIDGLEMRIRKKIHAMFMARWGEYFHVPAMTAAYRFEPEYCRRDFDPFEKLEVNKVLKQMATNDHSYAAIVTQLSDHVEALGIGSHDLTDDIAFSPAARRLASYKWADTFMAPWPGLCWAAKRLVAMTCSASGCEDSWSVEAWIHSKKRNRLGKKTVERLVRAHTNLLLEDVLENWESHALPWEIEMMVEEPEDDE